MSVKFIIRLCLMSLLPAAFATQAGTEHQHEHEEQHTDELITISERMIALNNIETATAGAYQLQQNIELFGVIAAMPRAQFNVSAPYAGQVLQVLADQGDTVKKGQLLARINNSNSLKSYNIVAPASGVITQRYVNTGEIAGNQPLLHIADYSQVYVELSAFPRDIARLQLNMPVTVFSLHQTSHASSQLSYIAPQMTDGHIARARAVIDNKSGYWRPGMHVKAMITVAQHPVSLAVKKSALQQIDGKPVIFIVEDGAFKATELQLGKDDSDYVEVVAGLAAGTRYVSENSFLLKADMLKAGAGHQH